MPDTSDTTDRTRRIPGGRLEGERIYHLLLRQPPAGHRVERSYRDGLKRVVPESHPQPQRCAWRENAPEYRIGARTRIEYFNGPHMIHGKGAVDFVRAVLGR
jgi:hypothetical protein